MNDSDLCTCGHARSEHGESGCYEEVSEFNFGVEEFTLCRCEAFEECK